MAARHTHTSDAPGVFWPRQPCHFVARGLLEGVQAGWVCCSIYLQQTGDWAEHETEPCGRLGHAEEESERLMDQQVGHFREARVAKSYVGRVQAPLQAQTCGL